MKKVKISITVPYENIPKEIENILMRSTLKVADISVMLKEANRNNLFNLTNEIEKIRQELIIADSNLEDAYNILLGYLKSDLESKIDGEKNESQDS